MKTTILKCPSCGGSITAEIAGRSYVYCNYCGEKIHIDDKKNEYTYNYNIRVEKNIHKQITDDAEIIKARYKDKEDRRSYILIIGMFVFALIILLLSYVIPQINKNTAIRQGKIQAGFYRDYIDQNYEAIEKQFHAAGFTNIEIIDLNEPGLFGTKKNKIKSVSIAGDSSFDSGDWFYPSDIVIISHY